MASKTTYTAPGVDVIIERSAVEQQSAETDFLNVYVGTGITSRNRNIEKTNIKADTTNFPRVTLTFDLVGEVNTDLFSKMNFTIGQVVVKRATTPEGEDTELTLQPTTDYTIEQQLTFSKTDSTASVTLNILNASVTANDVIYNLDIQVGVADKDFDLRVIGAEDRFFSKELFGPVVLNENDEEFYNDIAIAAEIAFRMEVPRFYYLEVPRNYGEQPTIDDYRKALDKIYFHNDAYRIVPLTSDPEVVSVVNQLVSAVSNPVDRRETVGFISYDTTKITNMDDINELVEKVGGYSQSMNNKRIVNVFGGESAEILINSQLYVVPDYYVSAAVASLDSVVGKVDPLSLRTIDVFERINGPKFRPRQWDLLAKNGVFIVMQDNDSTPAVIRHQLTTSKSTAAEDQEYSIVKNFDVVVKKIRDRFAVYAGQFNVESGYTERLEGTMATVRQEIIEEKLAKDLTVITPWSQRENSDGRNLVTRLKMSPVYPANDLDVYLII